MIFSTDKRKKSPKVAMRRYTIFDFAKSFFFVSFLICFFWMMIVLSTAKAAPYNEEISQLENAVWTAEDADLYKIENRVVKLIQVSPRSAKAHYLLSHVYFRMYSNNPAELYLLRSASDMAEQAIELDKQDDAGYVALADVLDLMGQTPKALLLLEQVSSKEIKQTWRSLFTKARLLADGLDNEKVMNLLEQAMKTENAQPNIIVPYIVAVLQTSLEGEELVKELESWNTRFQHVYFEESLATVYAQNKEYEKAHKKYLAIQAIHPNNKEAMINDAVILYKHLNRLKPGEILLNKVLSQYEKDLSITTKAIILAHLGAISLKLKQPEKARSYFFESLVRSPGYLPTIDFISRAYKESKDPKSFANLLQSISDEVPGEGILYALLGETFSEDLKMHKEALSAFENAIILEPERSDFHTGIGLVYYRMNKLEEALRSFKSAISIDSSDSVAHYNHACVLAKMGETTEALKSLQEAIILDPKLRKNALSDEDFEALRGLFPFQKIVEGNPSLNDFDDIDDTEGKTSISH